MKRRYFLAASGSLLLPLPARAQPRMRRVGVVSVGELKRQPLASLVQGLRELGHEEGRNLELLAPTASQYGRLEELAAVLVKREPEVIVTWGTTATRAAKAATWTTPIVMVIGGDPVASGFVRSLARPEGNITGISTSAQALSLKRVELVREMLPGIRRIGLLWSGESGSQAITMKRVEDAAVKMGLAVHDAEVSDPRALKAAFEALSAAKVEALIPIASALLNRESAEIAKLALARRIPVIAYEDNAVRAGALVSYGPDYPAQFRRAATLVDRVLKGAKPAEMAVEQPTKFELVINLKTAKTLGIEIPKEVMFRADEVIQ